MAEKQGHVVAVDERPITRLLKDVRKTILDAAEVEVGVLVDTLWMPGPCPETVVDALTAAIESPTTTWNRDAQDIAEPEPVEGIHTVAWSFECANCYTESRGYYDYSSVITKLRPEEYARPVDKIRCIEELVTRSQAEAIIAAKDVKLVETAQYYERKISDLEADNAALKGRPTEVYQVFLQGSWIDCPKAAFDKYVADGKTTRELVVKGV